MIAGDWHRWSSHFERIAALGFTHVLIAPPFLPGPTGNLYLVLDHHRLHPGLGGGDATEALAGITKAAAEHGLRVMLDLVVDRVAQGSSLTGKLADSLPDPRLRSDLRGAAFIGFDEGKLSFWLAMMAEWQDADIAGFRCEAMDRVPPETGAFDRGFTSTF